MFEVGLKQSGNTVFVGERSITLESAGMRTLVDRSSEEVERDTAHIVFRYLADEPQYVYELLHKRLYGPIGSAAFSCESAIARSRAECDRLLPNLRRAEMIGRIRPYVLEMVAAVASCKSACQQDIENLVEIKRLCSLLPPMGDSERLLWGQAVAAIQSELSGLAQRMPAGRLVGELTTRIMNMPPDKGRALLQACRQSLLPLDESDLAQLADTFAQAHFPQLDEMLEQAKTVQKWAQSRIEMDLQGWFARLPYGLKEKDVLASV